MRVPKNQGVLKVNRKTVGGPSNPNPLSDEKKASMSRGVWNKERTLIWTSLKESPTEGKISKISEKGVKEKIKKVGIGVRAPGRETPVGEQTLLRWFLRANGEIRQ